MKSPVKKRRNALRISGDRAPRAPSKEAPHEGAKRNQECRLCGWQSGTKEAGNEGDAAEGFREGQDSTAGAFTVFGGVSVRHGRVTQGRA